MALPAYDHENAAAAFLAAGGHLTASEGADMDEAFDNAVSVAYENPAEAGAWVAADPARLHAVPGEHSMDAAVAAALTWLSDDPEPGAVAAFAVLGRSAHTRVTRRARIEGVEFSPAEGPGAAWQAPEDALGEAIVAAGAGPEEGEVLEKITIGRRARYKPVATSNPGKSEAQFVVLNGATIVSSGHRTASEARRAAVTLLKDYPKDNHQQVKLEVFKLAGRLEAKPLVEVNRVRQAQVLTVKAVYAKLKDSPRPPKVVGWVFVTADAPVAPVGDADEEDVDE